MDKIRDSASRLKKQIRHRLAGSKRESRGTESGVHTESADPTGPLPRSGPHVEPGSCHDAPQPDEPESVLARGSEDDLEKFVAGSYQVVHTLEVRRKRFS